jgi:hypothetical protein
MARIMPPAHHQSGQIRNRRSHAEKKWLAAGLTVALGAGVTASAVLATAQSGQTTTTLATAPLAPFAIKSHYRPDPQTSPPTSWSAFLKTKSVTDGYVVDNNFTAGGTTGWHTHQGPSLIFVVSGTITNYRDAKGVCSAVNYPAGSAFIDAGGNDIHMLKNNTTSPAETIAVQLIPHGLARRIDEPQPGDCGS